MLPCAIKYSTSITLSVLWLRSHKTEPSMKQLKFQAWSRQPSNIVVLQSIRMASKNLLR